MKCSERSQEKDSGTGVEKWVSYNTAVEEHEAAMQREEERMAAGLVEMNRDKTRDWIQEKDREFKWEEWDWESVIEGDGSTREAFEPRGSKGLECQIDGEEKTGKGGKDEQEKGGDERVEGSKEGHEDGGKERQKEDGKEVYERREEGKESRRQDDGQDEGGNEMLRRQDDDDEDDKKQGNVVRRQFEGDMRQDGDGRGWATDVWKNDEGEKRGEIGKGGERVNLEDFFRRYKQAQGEQQQQQQGGRDEKDGGCEQRQEMRVKYKFIKTTFIKKSIFIKIHFHQNPISSKSNFFKNQFHQKTVSSKTTFITNHFHHK